MNLLFPDRSEECGWANQSLDCVLLRDDISNDRGALIYDHFTFKYSLFVPATRFLLQTTHLHVAFMLTLFYHLKHTPKLIPKP